MYIFNNNYNNNNRLVLKSLKNEIGTCSFPQLKHITFHGLHKAPA